MIHWFKRLGEKNSYIENETLKKITNLPADLKGLSEDKSFIRKKIRQSRTKRTEDNLLDELVEYDDRSSEKDNYRESDNNYFIQINKDINLPDSDISIVRNSDKFSGNYDVNYSGDYSSVKLKYISYQMNKVIVFEKFKSFTLMIIIIYLIYSIIN